MEEKKKILLLSSGDVNGAYEAIYRIASFLKADGHEVAMAVKNKSRGDSFIYEIPFENNRLLAFSLRVWRKLTRVKLNADQRYLFLDEDESRRYCKVKNILRAIPFTPDTVITGMTTGFTVTRHLAEIQRLTSARTFAITVDMSVLTGGCHFAWDCNGYKTDCSNCPAVGNPLLKNWPKKNLKRKKRNLGSARAKIIAGSGWTYDQAKQSALYKNQPTIESIIGCIDTNIFHARDRATAKSHFNIPSDVKLIFCGAQNFKDSRKGFAYFIEAIAILYKKLPKAVSEKIHVMVVDKNHSDDPAPLIPFKIQRVRFVTEYALLSLLYQAADLFVCSSIEDSGPMMVSEALACGTPVAGFEMGAVTNMVVSGYNGYKAILKDSADLAIGMEKILMLPAPDFNEYSKNAVAQVEKVASPRAFLKTFEKL